MTSKRTETFSKLIQIYSLLLLLSVALVGYGVAHRESNVFAFSITEFYSGTRQIPDTSLEIDGSYLLVQGNSLLPLSSISIPLAGYSIKEVYLLDVTGYSSTLNQTDEEPYINAANRSVRWGTVATNFPNREEALPFDTKIRVPEFFPDQVFVVEDRMNARFSDRLDIWFPTKYQASAFGIHRRVIVELLEEI